MIMKIGIFYATYSGGTQMASEFLAEKLKSLGHEVTLKQISEISFDETLTYDLRVFTSPSWDNESEEGQPHIDFISFIQKSAGKNFSGKPCAVFGLGDSTYAHF
ncbi:MAG: nitrogenase (flavodoxin), partial [Candidatus Roizmanbacteria bacterium GW2011_GWC2_35_12]